MSKRYLEAALGKELSASQKPISSATLEHVGGHDRLRVWSRGSCAGELVLAEGDGASLAMAHGLEERPEDPT